ncbi:hypothetical protein AYK25_08760 [Thermoplasmatales archaeon SM1-50]|nr:MAG: hypothetical protein AYK25_08760 [Thermoplasmatales archaeon SM1-50]
MHSNDDSTNNVQNTTELTRPLTLENRKEKRPEPERKLIKFDKPEKTATVKVENTSNVAKTANDKTYSTAADTARDELEQRRTILQNIKDFDFQIKKNQEDINIIANKVESLSKDLDDLVSLYEIVSEQMNPFVGLSKVTKKRLDALENIIKEIDGVKTKINDLEAMVENTSIYEKSNDTQTLIKTSGEIPSMHPIGEHSSFIKNITDKDVDDLLNRSLESLLMEQKVDTIINEFFINLK